MKLPHNKICGLSSGTASWFLERDVAVKVFKLTVLSYINHCNVVLLYLSKGQQQCMSFESEALPLCRSYNAIRNTDITMIDRLPCILASTYSKPFMVFVTLVLNLARPNSWKRRHKVNQDSKKTLRQRIMCQQSINHITAYLQTDSQTLTTIKHRSDSVINHSATQALAATSAQLLHLNTVYYVTNYSTTDRRVSLSFRCPLSLSDYVLCCSTLLY